MYITGKKDYTCLECLITSKNSPKSWLEKIKCNRVCFISVGVRAVLRFLVSIKKLKQYKKLPWDKFVKKKNLQTLSSMQNFLEIQCLVDDSVDF